MHEANAYVMAELTYKELFDRSDVVVIATAISTKNSTANLKIEPKQAKELTDQIKTVETKFRIAYTLKGKVNSEEIEFLHLNTIEKKDFVGVFGALGTFFVDFNSKHAKRHSYMLFMKKGKDGKYSPAWNSMEGSRAMIAVRKDKEFEQITGPNSSSR